MRLISVCFRKKLLHGGKMKKIFSGWGPIYQIIGISTGFFLLTILLLFFQGSFDLLESWMLRTFINKAEYGNEVISLYGYTALFIFLEALFGGISGWVIGKMAVNGKERIQLCLAERLLRCSYDSYSEMGTGEWQTRLHSDSLQCVEYVKYLFQTVIYGVIFLIGPLCIAFIVSWPMALLSLLMVPVVLFCSAKFSTSIGNASEEIQNLNGKINQIFQEYIWQIPANKAYSVQKEWTGHIHETLEDVYQSKRKLLKAQIIYEPFLSFVQMMPQIIIMSAGGIFLLNGLITAGDLMLFTIFFGYIANGLMGIPNWISELRKYSGYKKRVNEALALPSDVGEEQPQKEGKGILLQGASFSYGKDKFFLKGISANIRQGMHVAVIGESGCGKSTFLKLLAGLYRPQEGKATVLGYDLLRCKNEQLFSHMALILQDTYLFPGTIRENLVIGCGAISDEEIREACIKAKLWDWILTLPQGLQTVLVEFSSNISGGQRQRIGIARAILRGADLWLIDEPTSALDSSTAMEVEENLREITKELTTVTVTHRLDRMDFYDLIFIMENGSIAEQGTHGELLRKSRTYMHLLKGKEGA